MTLVANNWGTHDFMVKSLDWNATRGSRLAYRCRRCGRNFCLFSGASRDRWAVDAEGRALEGIISTRWLGEECPRLFTTQDNEDRKRLSRPAA